MDDIDAAATADVDQLARNGKQLRHDANSLRDAKWPADIADAAEFEHLDRNIVAGGMCAELACGRNH